MSILSIQIYPTEPKFLLELPVDQQVRVGDYVIVNYPEVGEEAGLVTAISDERRIPANEQEKIHGSRDFLRLATEHDLQIIEGNKQRVEQTLEQCEDKIQEHALQMKLVTAHFGFNGRGLLIIFTAENRVDFRNLVKDLAKTFQKQIRLKQIGPRDRSQLVGGYGRCGRNLCCSGWLCEMKSITMDMVRCQGLTSKGAAKISGNCGKLLCCLRYEVDLYQELAKSIPGFGAIVKVGRKEGRVVGQDILNQKVKVEFTDGSWDFIEIRKLQIIKEAVRRKEIAEEESSSESAHIEG